MSKIYFDQVMDKYKLFIKSPPGTFNEVYIRGGRGSGKSIACIQRFIMNIAQREHEVFGLLRNDRVTVEYSSLRLLMQGLQYYGIRFRHNKQSNNLYIPSRDILVRVEGLKDESKLRSASDLTVVFLEEASEVAAGKIDDLLYTMLRNTNAEFFCAYNPLPLPPGLTGKSRHWLQIAEERASEPEDTKSLFIHTTVNDIPKQWLAPDLVRRIQRAWAEREEDPVGFKLNILGEFAHHEGNVFSYDMHYRIIDNATFNQQFHTIDAYGLDLGSTDPTAFLAAQIDLNRKEIHVRELIYKPLENQTLKNMLKLMYDKRELDYKAPIYLDPHDARTASVLGELKESLPKMTVKPSKMEEFNKKLAWIELLKQFVVIIHENDSNIISEFGTFRWEALSKLKAEELGKDFKQRTIDAYDHLISALAYAVVPTIRLKNYYMYQSFSFGAWESNSQVPLNMPIPTQYIQPQGGNAYANEWDAY